jgi:hypothetical protein
MKIPRTHQAFLALENNIIMKWNNKNNRKQKNKRKIRRRKNYRGKDLTGTGWIQKGRTGSRGERMMKECKKLGKRVEAISIKRV